MRQFISKIISNKKILLILIILIAVLFRFYKLHEWYFFGMDQENEALIIRNILSGNHFPLIGLSNTDTGIYRGPAFLYLFTIPYLLFSGNPIAGAYVASTLGVMACVLIYLVGSKLFNRSVGLIASLLYAASFLVSFYERQFWNPSVIPIFSLLLGLFIFKVVTRKSYMHAIVLVALFSLAVHSHLSILIFTPLILYSLWSIRKNMKKRQVLFICLIFIAVQSPLLLFDLRHNFLNSKAILDTIRNTSSHPIITSSSINRNNLFISSLGRFIWLPPVTDLFVESGQCKELLYLRKNPLGQGLLLNLFIAFCLSLYWFQKRKEVRQSNFKNTHVTSLQLVLSIYILTVVFIQLYNRQVFEYYLTYFFPWLSILIAWCIMSIWNKIYAKAIVLSSISLFIILNLITLFTAYSSYSYKDKIETLAFIKSKLTSRNYSLEALGECPKYGGYRYLTDYFVGKPIYSYMDTYFGWLYPDTIKDIPSENIVLLSLIDPRNPKNLNAKFEETKIHLITENKQIAEGRFGKLQVYILSP